MNHTISIAVLALSLTSAAFGQTMQPFPALAPLPAFAPASQLTTQASAQQDLDKNNTLLVSLQQLYNATDSRLQTLSSQMTALNAINSKRVTVSYFLKQTGARGIISQVQ